jgi:hypothetical protein
MRWEKLSIQIDVNQFLNSLEMMSETFGPPVMQDDAFGGYSLQSQTGDWKDGFEFAYSYIRNTGNGNSIGREPHEYNKRTAVCEKYFSDYIDKLEELNFYPRRTRLTLVKAGSEMTWHQDAPMGSYCVRLHLALVTNSEVAFQTKDNDNVHIPRDGYLYALDTSTMHRSVNYGSTDRWHIISEVWDEAGITEHFKIKGDELSYSRLKGHEIYQRVMHEKTST